MLTRGYSLLELLVTLGLALLLAAASAPAVLAAREAVLAIGAADYAANVIQLARYEALKRQANVAVRFEPEGSGYRFAFYADSNGDGVRSSQVTAGIDILVRQAERLGEHFPGVDFGLDQATTPVEAGESFTDRDPVKFGRSRMISFSPTGTCTPGTLYILGRGRRQLAVRVLGATGRLRVLQYNFGTNSWQPR